MFERFTDRSRRCVVLAVEITRDRGHAEVTPLHLLYGLVAENEGVAAQVLREGGATAELLAERLAARPSDRVVQVHPPFSPEVKRALEFALREAYQLNLNYIGTEALLLGVLRAGEVPDDLGLVNLRDAVLGKLGLSQEQADPNLLKVLEWVAGHGGAPPADAPAVMASRAMQALIDHFGLCDSVWHDVLCRLWLGHSGDHCGSEGDWPYERAQVSWLRDQRMIRRIKPDAA